MYCWGTLHASLHTHNIHWMHVCFLASDLLTKCWCHAFLCHMPFSKVCGFLGSKMAAYEEFITPIYTFFLPKVFPIGKTSMGYKTFFEQIKTVCAWNSLTSIFWPCLIQDCYYGHKIMYAFYSTWSCQPLNWFHKFEYVGRFIVVYMCRYSVFEIYVGMNKKIIVLNAWCDII